MSTRQRSQTVEQLRHTSQLRKVAAGAIAAWAIIASFGVVSEAVQEHNDRQALNVAHQALRQDARAFSRAAAAEATAVQASQLAAAIAKARRDLILSSCNRQNSEHTSTIREMRRLAAHSETHGTAPQRQRARLGLRESILLVDQLEPYLNCQAQLKGAP